MKVYQHQMSQSEMNKSFVISTLTSTSANSLISHCEFDMIFDSDINDYFSIDLKIDPKLKNIWSSNMQHAVQTVKGVMRHLKVDLAGEDFKIHNVSNCRNILSCVLSGYELNGGCDAIVNPKFVAIESAQKGIRVMFQFKTPDDFQENKIAQSVGELIGGNYNANHPFILVKTDLLDNFQMWQIRGRSIHRWNSSGDIALQVIKYWLENISSKDSAFSWLYDLEKHPIDDCLIHQIKYLYNKFKIPILKDLEELLLDQFEVASMADSCLLSF